jgi:DNA-binding response OmpR family regulator
LLLVHWNEDEAQELAEPLIAAGWQVEVEAEDGARASQRGLDDPPVALVIYLTRLPSHGRETARYLRSRPPGRSLPIIFVGGDPERVEAARTQVPDAEFLAPAALIPALERLASRPSAQDASHA